MTHVIPFSFEDQSVRVMDQNGKPWFVLADVCKVLAISNPSQAATRLDDDEKGIITTDTPSGDQQMLIINESGLWAMVLTSRKPQAKRFRKWVTADVIPSIRKNGSYGVVNPHPPLTDGISAVRETRYTWGKPAAKEMWLKMGLPTVPAMFVQPPQLSFLVTA